MDERNNNLIFDNISPKKIFSGNNESILILDQGKIIESNKINVALQKGKNKFFVIFFLLLSSFFFITLTLFKLSVTSDKINISESSLEVTRGKIVDRNDKIISASIPTLDLYIDGSKIIDKKKTIENLKKIFIKKKDNFFADIIAPKKKNKPKDKI